MSNETKQRWSRAGYVAEYCRLCRDIRLHTLLRSARAGLDPIAIVECRTCSQRANADLGEFASVAPSREDDVVALMHRTNPLLPAKIEERVLLDRAALDGTLPQPERLHWIREPFLLTQLMFSEPQSPLALFAGGAVLAITPWIVTIAYMDRFKFNAFIGVVMGIDLVFWLALFTGMLALITRWNERRRFRKRVLPRIARALRPLKPTDDELGMAFSWLRVVSPRMWRLVNLHQLKAEIPRQPDTAMLIAGTLDILGMAADLRAGEAASRS